MNSVHCSHLSCGIGKGFLEFNAATGIACFHCSPYSYFWYSYYSLVQCTYLTCGVQRCYRHSMFPTSSILLLLPLGRKGLDLHTSLPPPAPASKSLHVLAVKPGFLKTQIIWNLILIKHTKLAEKTAIAKFALLKYIELFLFKMASF